MNAGLPADMSAMPNPMPLVEVASSGMIVRGFALSKEGFYRFGCSIAAEIGSNKQALSTPLRLCQSFTSLLSSYPLLYTSPSSPIIPLTLHIPTLLSRRLPTNHLCSMVGICKVCHAKTSPSLREQIHLSKCLFCSSLREELLI